MTDINERPERAFPSTYKSLDEETHIHAWGMTLRDWMAGMAMQAIATRSSYDVQAISEFSYQLADAMLKARNQ